MRKWVLQIWSFWLLLGFFQQGLAQNVPLSNWRYKQLPVETPIQAIDSLTIIPNSISIQALATKLELDSSSYKILDNKIIWQLGLDQLPDSISLSYRVLPFRLGATRRHLDSLAQQQAYDGLIGFQYEPYRDIDRDLIDFPGLDYAGSFSRGISVGNNQDLVLNSSFNLQLAGKLGDDVEVLAAITDENIPIQPEGNTQQLREFDKVFIQLSRTNNKLIAGDYELNGSNSYFLRYFKKLQGATLNNSTPLENGASINTQASVAVARGKFARQSIQQQEGNQGPYKLLGAEGERFIIVLAGTEKVWIDGQQLSRGLDQDYVIDYNRGEITFTNRRIITKDSRISVEFDYSDQNYLRTLYHLGSTYEHERFRFSAQVYSEQDNKNATGNLALTDQQKQVLKASGDQTNAAVISSLDSIEEFNASRAYYQAIDTLLPCGRRDTILVYTTNQALAQFSAQFTLLGPGRGNYRLAPELAANERAYEWVDPDPITCEPQGEYEPIRPLIAPKQQRVLTFGGAYEFSKNTQLQAEVSLSTFDQNRFSTLDRDDDQGMAAYLQFDRQFQLGGDSSRWRLDTGLKYEFVQENFRPIAPYRNPEFLRNWSIANRNGQGSVEAATENLIFSTVNLRHLDYGQLKYELNTFNRTGQYQGLQQGLDLRYNNQSWDIQARGSWLEAESELENSQFIRPTVNISKTFKKGKGWRLGWQGEGERNRRNASTSDTLAPSSFYFTQYRYFLEGPREKAIQFYAHYNRRQDYLPLDTKFATSALAEEVNVNGSWQLARALNMATNLTYRKLQVLDAERENATPGQTFLGRTDLRLTLWKGALRSVMTYELGSGQEPKREFTYVRVNPGEGTHIWLDSLYNKDGVVQPNEMEIAPFRDKADFIKISTFSDDFIGVNYVQLNQSLQLNPKALWFNKEGIRKALSKLSLQSTFNINRRTREAPNIDAWNPFQLDIVDTALVALNTNVRNLLFFNRADPKYDIQLGQTNVQNKIVQTTGFESRRNQEYFLRSRINLSRIFSLELDLTRQERLSDSQNFDNKDYRIRSNKVGPKFTYLPNPKFRTILKYQYQQDQNRLGDSGEQAQQHNLSLESTFNTATNTSLRLNVSLVQIKFDGQANSPVGFAILNGLQVGSNYLWNLRLDRRLTQNIQLGLSYEGRKTGTARVVHVGRAQVAALF